jgi:hypothetical protein
VLLPCYLSPLLLIWLFDPISIENRIWGDGNGTGWCDANGSRLCPVRCWKCVRVLVSTMSIRLSEDNHNSWVTCTTSVECKTVITAMLTVMSSMDPHMIRWNLRWVWFGLVGWFVEVDLIGLWVGHGVTP